MGRVAPVRRLTRVYDDPSPGFPARLFRLSYNPSTDTYTHDAGFPVTINDYKTETLVIDKDSTGKLWATWVQGTTVYVSHTVDGDAMWAAPSALPAAGATGLAADDISSLIAFGGDQIGVMWSNQQASKLYFAIHNDADPASLWKASETALAGDQNVDDSINLKTDQFDFVLQGTSPSHGMSAYSSREGSNPPQLVLETS